MRIEDISVYNVAGQDRYNVVWLGGPAVPKLEYRVNVTSTEFPLEAEDLYRQGYRPLAISAAAPSSGTEKYASIWQNPYWSQTDLDKLDTAIKRIKQDGVPADKDVNADGVPEFQASVSFALGVDGRLVYARAIGLARTAADPVKPAHTSTLYRIASISKPIASAATMTLLEQGKLSLNSTIFGTGSLTSTMKYGSQTTPYTAAVQAITVKMLLNHTSGLGGLPPGLAGQLAPWAVGVAVDSYPTGIFPPRPHFYSNLGYLCLARAIEKTANLVDYGYGDWVKQYVLSPMGITSMQIGKTDPRIQPLADEAFYYDTQGGKPYSDNPIPEMDGNGGWIATAADLVRFDTYVDGQPTVPDFFSPATIKMIYTPSPGSIYGLGWYSVFDGAWHNGGIPGNESVLRRYNPGIGGRQFGSVYAALTNATAIGVLNFTGAADTVMGPFMADTSVVIPNIDFTVPFSSL
jgi:CubicO group peptidase (beta-lactamase class C family)